MGSDRERELNLDVSAEDARAMHRVWRALNDGDCPSCHELITASGVIREIDGGMQCPRCQFQITGDEVKAIEKEFAPIMQRSMDVFRKWRLSRSAKPKRKVVAIRFADGKPMVDRVDFDTPDIQQFLLYLSLPPFAKDVDLEEWIPVQHKRSSYLQSLKDFGFSFWYPNEHSTDVVANVFMIQASFMIVFDEDNLDSNSIELANRSFTKILYFSDLIPAERLLEFCKSEFAKLQS